MTGIGMPTGGSPEPRLRLGEILHSSGLDLAQPALLLWEGATNYLAGAAVDSVLRCVAECHPGSRIVLTYVHSGMLDGSVFFEGAERFLIAVLYGLVLQVECDETIRVDLQSHLLDGFLAALSAERG